MAATTSGWQWPVEVTAMPEEKSRNSLPSTSSITQPRPRLATSGYERVYDGEIHSLSSSTICFAFGPGSLVLISGPAVLGATVLVAMSVSPALRARFGLVAVAICHSKERSDEESAVIATMALARGEISRRQTAM